MTKSEKRKVKSEKLKTINTSFASGYVGTVAYLTTKAEKK